MLSSSDRSLTWHESASQQRQPMSIVTVASQGGQDYPSNENSNVQVRELQDQSELLTSRFLEASERKIRLIRELISPERYRSIEASLLLDADSEGIVRDDTLKQGSSTPKRSSRRSLRSIRFADEEQILGQNEHIGSNGSSSEHKDSLDANEESRGTTSSSGVEQNLSKKQEAIEFFFVNQDHSSDGLLASNSAASLAIELKSGYYITDRNIMQGSGAQNASWALTREANFASIIDRIVGLLSLVGVHLGQNREVLSDDERKFIDQFKKRNCAPYNSDRNLLSTKRRLESDGLLNKSHSIDMSSNASFGTKIANQSLADENEKHCGGDHLQRLARIQANLVSSNHLMSISRSKPFYTIGHFNAIYLLESRPFRQFCPNRILNENIVCSRSLSRIVFHNDLGAINLSDQITYPRMGKSNSLSVNLVSFKFVCHHLMLEENKLAVKLIDLRDFLDEMKVEYLSITKKFIESLDQINQVEPELDTNRFERLSDRRLKLLQDMMAMQQDALTIYDKILSLRDEQKFLSAPIVISESKHEFAAGLSNLMILKINKIIDMIEYAKDLGEIEVGDLVQKFKVFLELESKFKSLGKGLKFDIQEISSVVTSPDESVKSELERRKNESKWLASLRVRVLLKYEDQWYFYDCFENVQVQPDWKQCIAELDLRRHQLILGPLIGNGSQLNVRIQVWTRSSGLNPKFLITGKLLGESSMISLKIEDGVCSHDLELQFFDGLNSSKLEFTTIVSQTYESQVRSRCKQERLIEDFYQTQLSPSHSLDDYGLRLYKLINRLDLRDLSDYLNIKIDTSFFKLDPFCDNDFKTSKAVNTINFSNSNRTPKQDSDSMRHRILGWRWTTKKKRMVVHLDDRENSLSIQKSREWSRIRHKLELIEVKPESGYRSIDHLRIKAIDSIRRFELQLEEMIRNNSHGEYSSSVSYHDGVISMGGAKTRDILLREPHFRMAELTQTFRMLRQLIPKRQVRRPLMPRRRQTPLLSDDLRIDEQSFRRRPLDGPIELETELDRLASDSDRKSNFAGVSTRQQLQLVITIQQALNVPMRISTLSTMSPFHQQLFRSVSPVFNSLGRSAATSGRLGGISPVSGTLSPVAAGNHNETLSYLSPPTTYVEVVFQRKQQASSLALGQNPSWNETLFFRVDSMKGDQSIGSEQQLVDDFFQVNLYDYKCFSNNQQTNAGLTDFETRAGLVASSDIVPLSSTASQRIERHLLGSLRIPLATLLASGRIEGSFAMSQPMLLDGYQFGNLVPPSTQRSLMDSGTVNQAFGLTTPHGTDSNENFRGPAETHLSLFVTLDPPVAMPLHIHLPVGGYESDRLIEYARNWENFLSRSVSLRRTGSVGQSSASGPSMTVPLSMKGASQRARQSSFRHVRALVIQRDGKYCFIHRLIMPLKPPNSISGPSSDESNQTGSRFEQQADRISSRMAHLARYVSLMQPLKYGLFNLRQLASSVWFNSVELINEQLGGHEERAVLLCNYFLYLGKCSALLLGDAISEGQCVYVIVWQEQTGLIESQLALQASQLMESIQTIGSSQDVNGLSSPSSMVEPIDRDNFQSRLPIILNSRASIRLWDPTKGRCYSLSDRLPLVSVGSIVTIDNVYANIQLDERPSETNFDFRLRNNWMPLLECCSASESAASATVLDRMQQQQHRRLNRKLTSMSWRKQQHYLELFRRSISRPEIVNRPVFTTSDSSNPINYDTLTSEQCKELEESLDKSIKAHLLKLRPARPTYFNRTLSRLLSDKLGEFEAYTQLDDPSKATGTDWRQELANVIRNEVLVAHLSASGANKTRQLVSWPANVTYTNMATILDSLFASGVHNADLSIDQHSMSTGQLAPNIEQELAQAANGNGSTGSTQFLVACRVHAYPARVISVWLYVAAVVTSGRALLAI